MCGITGWIDWQADLTRQRPIVEAMTHSLAHRGPDGAGIWLSPHAALGHRRLVVVDPAGGAQPMVRRRGENAYVLTYNGELYNTNELRRDLAVRGYAFRGHSDTEVLLVSFMEWGKDCLFRLNGIFAFAVWSEADQSLFLARDRLGVKPLFYAQRDQSFLFGSEPKALLAHPAVKPEVDAEGLAEVFGMGPARTPGHGIYRGIEELRPGHYLICDRNGIRLRRYWSLESRFHPDDLDTTTSTVRALLQDAVERQLVADVPVCTLLSGGLDSSAITAFAGMTLNGNGRPQPLRTYSIDYRDNDLYFRPDRFQPDSDAPWVQRVSRFLGTHHRPVVIDTPALVEALTVAVRLNDRPGMADVDASLYLFCHEVKREATVALSGESADEIFGGYPWFHSPEALASGTFPWIRMMRERAGLLSPELRAWIRPEEYVLERYREALAEVPRLPGEDPAACRVREAFHLNITRFMPMLLDRKDRMSMGNGLEVRVPFCDHRLVEYVWNIPWAMKCCNGREKGILRRALTGLLPADVLARRKSPYPKTHNPAYLAAVRDRLAAILDEPASPLLPLLDVTAVRATIRANGMNFSPAWFSQLMGPAQLFAYLIQVDTWLREYRVSIG